ncbi:hypothetical protein LAC81_08620 [Ensifer adhaerens]|uniref:hypothetical protein n=1 Tax=Ensifer adhaerens TaxID=106592 RepID=UPI001CBAEE32|nr:hypothetical protein [Ensifer adhaerens]MBZ7921843.1 hypothetical protein [Ensifer adhaerens]UAX94242.1 hypothetical protein LAC78_08615 [Ensifer adhaerens]UAY01877.1 hypothetical protein LAC80_08625 [Ensifer adhaerens]UAY09260.1 hypothetical protein LAC81_08620 [Ensifer adhaerens]
MRIARQIPTFSRRKGKDQAAGHFFQGIGKLLRFAAVAIRRSNDANTSVSLLSENCRTLRYAQAGIQVRMCNFDEIFVS